MQTPLMEKSYRARDESKLHSPARIAETDSSLTLSKDCCCEQGEPPGIVQQKIVLAALALIVVFAFA